MNADHDGPPNHRRLSPLPLHTQHSLAGFIASDPQQSVIDTGDTRSHVRVGQPPFRREDSGSFTVLGPSFQDLVTYRATVERALKRLAKGDRFVTEADVRNFEFERNGRILG